MRKISVWLAFMLTTGVAQAATLDSVVGNVLVNRGKGFVPANETETLAAGDRIMTDKAATARLVCDDGAEVEVKPNSVMNVADCSIAALDAGGGAGGALLASAVPVQGVVAGVVGVAGVAGVASAASASRRSSPGDGPASP